MGLQIDALKVREFKRMGFSRFCKPLKVHFQE